MAKIRGIKPETWTDDKFVQLSPLARLLYIGMWNFACDNGHLEDNPLQLKMRILPADNCDIVALLDELTSRGRVERKNGFLRIPKLQKNQHIDRRWFTTCEWCPDDPDSTYPQRATTENKTSPRRAPSVSTSGTRLAQDADGDGDGDGELMVNVVAASTDLVPTETSTSTARKRAQQLPDAWQPNDHHHAIAAEHRVNVAFEVQQFRDYYRATGKPMKDWNAAFNNWLRKARPNGVSRRQQETDDMFNRAMERAKARDAEAAR